MPALLMALSSAAWVTDDGLSTPPPPLQDVRAVPALLAGYATYLLTQPDAWAAAELAEPLIEASLRSVPFFKRYMEVWLADPRAAMATANEAGEPLCEHLNKWLLAALVAHHRGLLVGGQAGGAPWDLPRLRGLMLDFLVEAVRRSKPPPALERHPAFEGRVEGPAPEALLASLAVDVDALRLCDALAGFREAAAAAFRADALLPSVRVGRLDDLKLSFWGLTEGGVLAAFRALARITGAAAEGNEAQGDGIAPLTSEERAGILCRAVNPAPEGTPPVEHIRRAFAGRHGREAMESAEAHVTRIYSEHVDAVHEGAPILFPAAWAARYEGERGLAAGDLWARYEVNPETLLSRAACGFANCPHYLRVLGVPLKPSEKPRIRDALTGHMSAWFPTPGFHCALKALGSDRSALPSLCAALPSGAHLKADEKRGLKVAAMAAHPPLLYRAECVFDAYQAVGARDSEVEVYARWAADLDAAKARHPPGP